MHRQRMSSVSLIPTLNSIPRHSLQSQSRPIVRVRRVSRHELRQSTSDPSKPNIHQSYRPSINRNEMNWYNSSQLKVELFKVFYIT